LIERKPLPEREPSDLSRLRIHPDRRGPSPEEHRRARLLLWVALVIGIAAVAGLLAWWGILSPAVEVRGFKVGPVFPSRALTLLNASGYVVAQRKAAVSSKATGILETLYVEEGKRVKAGEIIAQLENRDLGATLAEAQAGLKVAQALLRNAEAEVHDATLQFNRSKSLREAGAVSEQSYDAAEARYKKAAASERSARHAVDRSEATIKVAEVNLEYSFIRAPFSGVILTKNADKGEIVAPFGASVNAKAAVVTMADLASLMVEVDVAESSLGKVKVGGPAEIKLDAFPDERFPATVHMIVPTADRSKATVMTKLKFDRPDDRVLPEMSAKAAFLERPLQEDEHDPVIGIPIPAIRQENKTEAVFRIQNGRVRQVPVKTGRRWGETVEIVSGLTEGDMIVVQLSPAVRDGARVKILE